MKSHYVSGRTGPGTRQSSRTRLPPGTPGSLLRCGCHPIGDLACCGGTSGAIVIWVVPALALLGLATYLLFAPVPRRDISEEEAPPSMTTQVGYTIADSESGHKAGGAGSLPETKLEPKQAELLRKLEGDWVGYYQGQRHLSVRPNGTGTMTAEPEGFAAALLAAKLVFEIQWRVNGEVLEFETVRGEPADKVAIILKMYGAKRAHQILELSQENMVLLDEDGKTRYEWKRVAAGKGTGGALGSDIRN